ncbi:MAG: hypothetical protein RLZZ86_984 [Cyanobacteriota bacterium]|jgi:tetratricopeptide (TPR) repeat protein
MATRKAKQAILITALLGITGLMVVMPKLSMGQVNPPTTTTQSEELAEVERLEKQMDKLYKQGRYSEAIPLAERVLAMRKRLLNPEHIDVATSLNNLAELYTSQGRYAEAEPLYHQALEMIKRLFGQEHPRVATSLNNLALLYAKQGRYMEAEPLYRQALNMRKRLLGTEHLQVTESLNNDATLKLNPYISKL